MAAHTIFSTHQQHQLFIFAGKLGIAALALCAAGIFLPGPNPVDAAEQTVASNSYASLVASPCAPPANR